MSIHLGKAIQGLTVVSRHRNFWKLKHADHPDHKFILYYNAGVAQKKIDKTGFWVYSGYYDHRHHWFVMPHSRKTDCIDRLFNTLYSSGITGSFKHDSRYPWAEVWYDIAVNNPPVNVLRLPRNETADGWTAWYAELQNGDLVPLRGRYVHTLSSGQALFFPVPPTSAFGNVHPQQSCFQQDCIQWPMRYTVSLKKDGSAEDISTIFLLGPSTCTIKLHTSIRKHVYGLEAASRPNERQLWRNEFNWTPVSNGLTTFKSCPKACKYCSGQTEQVYGVQQLLEQDIFHYFETGITFLSKAATNNNRVEIYEKYQATGGVCLDISLVVELKGIPGKKLVVRGWTCDPHYSYFYVNFLTIYAGIMREEITNDYSLFTGKLTAITRN